MIDDERANVSPVQEAGARRPERRRRPAVSLDEVLDAHEFLKGFEGGVSDIIGGARGGAGVERDSRA